MNAITIKAINPSSSDDFLEALDLQRRPIQQEVSSKRDMKTMLGVRERINKRVKTANKTIKHFKEEVARCNNQIKKRGPGVAQQVMEFRKKRLIKEKRSYEGQRDMLNNQIFDLDRLMFAWDGIKDAQQIASCLKAFGTELLEAFRSF
ncbi:unnamed protein product [Lactuca saligna]|uniref:Uncharacterized protein n=1 Tax=Lactuca saligna TaxID=75948 RepID=A0AA35ZZJ3_LACSI|nr:unnamed protein product [Lactuca saligna]